MTGVEEIESAIATLTEWRNEIGEGVAYQSFGGVSFSPTNIVAPTTLIHGENAWDGALEIFVVLHRTIDAQLAILRGASIAYQHYVGSNGEPLDENRQALSLARAINGTHS